MNLRLDAIAIQKLQRDIVNAGEIPTKTLKKMVSKQGKVVKKAVVNNARSMLQGPYYKGDVARSVRQKRAGVSKKRGAYCYIKFDGKSHGNRNGEIAFVNEYGTKKQMARPFIREAQRDSADEATKAAGEVFYEHMRQRRL